MSFRRVTKPEFPACHAHACVRSSCIRCMWMNRCILSLLPIHLSCIVRCSLLGREMLVFSLPTSTGIFLCNLLNIPCGAGNHFAITAAFECGVVLPVVCGSRFSLPTWMCITYRFGHSVRCVQPHLCLLEEASSSWNSMLPSTRSQPS